MRSAITCAAIIVAALTATPALAQSGNTFIYYPFGGLTITNKVAPPMTSGIGCGIFNTVDSNVGSTPSTLEVELDSDGYATNAWLIMDDITVYDTDSNGSESEEWSVSGMAALTFGELGDGGSVVWVPAKAYGEQAMDTPTPSPSSILASGEFANFKNESNEGPPETATVSFNLEIHSCKFTASGIYYLPMQVSSDSPATRFKVRKAGNRPKV